MESSPTEENRDWNPLGFGWAWRFSIDDIACSNKHVKNLMLSSAALQCGFRNYEANILRWKVNVVLV